VIRFFACAVAVTALAGLPLPAQAFPPYRSTDADTAEPGTLELRTGLIGIERERGHNKYSTPLVRLNIGLPEHAEIVSELEYGPREGRLGDAAVGAKWAPIQGGLALGVETLALLPVRENDAGLGFEGQLLATLQGERAVLHVNAGGFHDARSSPSESGWRGSVLVEVPLDGFRPGVEAFAKQKEGESVDVRIGSGVIVALGRFDLRAGLHAGVTREAPDLTFSLWIATKFPFR
jgi:hypothetical protein